MLPLSTMERTRLIERYYRATDTLRQGLKQGISAEDKRSLKREKKVAQQEYFVRLPRMMLSRCPYTQAPLIQAFDPWGLDGFWWQSDELRKSEEPAPPPTFRVLVGAVNLKGLPPQGGRSEALTGPEVPFVIPRILSMPTMVAVVSAIPMANGYTAYPIAYFSEQEPPPASLTQTWRKRQYTYRLPNGASGWDIKADPWDFDLRPWVEQNKLHWIDPGDDRFMVHGGTWLSFPYKDLRGLREQVIIKNDTLRSLSPPNNETIEPFD